MDRGQQGGLDQSAVGEGEEVEAVVDEVEFPGPLEDRGDVQPLFHLGIEIGVVRIARGRGPDESGCGHGIGRGEQGDVDPSRD